MFKEPRYVTQGVEAEIPKMLQVYLWELISKMKVQDVDYLQVFKIAPVENGLKIIHTQEEPDYKAEYFYETGERVTAKVYCIDDVSHATMLLSSEY